MSRRKRNKGRSQSDAGSRQASLDSSPSKDSDPPSEPSDAEPPPGDEASVSESPLEPAPRVRVFDRPDWIACLLTTLITMAVYLFTIAPDVTLEDSGELAVGSMYAGVPHPPGYPMWTLYSWFFTVIIPVSNIAWRVAVSSAFAAAVSCGLLALMISRISRLFMEGIEMFRGMDDKQARAIRTVAGVTGGLLMGFHGYMWSQAVIVEVYTLAMLTFTITLALMLRWYLAPEKYWPLYLAYFSFGLGFANHQTLLLAALGLELLIVITHRKLGRDFLICNALVFLIGLYYFASKSPAEQQPGASLVIFGIFCIVGSGILIWLTWRALPGRSQPDNLLENHPEETPTTNAGLCLGAAWGLAVLFLGVRWATFNYLPHNYQQAPGALWDPTTIMDHLSLTSRAFTVLTLLFLGGGMMVLSMMAVVIERSARTIGSTLVLIVFFIFANLWVWQLLDSRELNPTTLQVDSLNFPVHIIQANFHAKQFVYLALMGILGLFCWQFYRGRKFDTHWRTLLLSVLGAVACMTVGSSQGWPWILTFLITLSVLGLIQTSPTQGWPMMVTRAAYIIGILIHLYMPIASSTNPPMNWAYPRTAAGFKHAVTRGQYDAFTPTRNLQKLFIDRDGDGNKDGGQVGIYIEEAIQEFNLAYLLAALVPFLLLRRMDSNSRRLLGSVTFTFFTFTLLIIVLRNITNNEMDRHLNKVFFIPSHLFIAGALGCGLALLAGLATRAYPRGRNFLLAGGALALGAELFFPGFEQTANSNLAYSLTTTIARYDDTTLRTAAFVGALLVAIMAALPWFLKSRLPLKVVLALTCLLPLRPLLANWADNEQRQHHFGYWYGHDMFHPPFGIYPTMERNAILYGGTDPGRFCPTYMIFCESFLPPKQRTNPKFDRRDVYIITQNALADGTYLQYIGAHYNRSAIIDPPFFTELAHNSTLKRIHQRLGRQRIAIENRFLPLLKKAIDSRNTTGISQYQQEMQKAILKISETATNQLIRANLFGSLSTKTSIAADLDTHLLRFGDSVERRRRVGDAYFSPDTITNLPALARSLRDPNNIVSAHVRAQLGTDTRKLLASRPSPALASALARDLNRLVEKEWNERVRRMDTIRQLDRGILSLISKHESEIFSASQNDLSQALATRNLQHQLVLSSASALGSNAKLFAKQQDNMRQSRGELVASLDRLQKKLGQDFQRIKSLLEKRNQQFDHLVKLSAHGRFYRSSLFEQSNLSPLTRGLIAENPSRHSRIRLNRLLLEDAFPGTLRPSRDGLYPALEINTPDTGSFSRAHNEYIADAKRRWAIGRLKQGEVIQLDRTYTCTNAPCTHSWRKLYHASIPAHARELAIADSRGEICPSCRQPTLGNHTEQAQAAGAISVMEINALLAREIFDQNPNNAFYIEESFPLDWMYPHLTPYGIIMKINRQPLEELSLEAMDRDRRFWRRYSRERLVGDWVKPGNAPGGGATGTTIRDISQWATRVHLRRDPAERRGANPRFLRDNDAQKAYSKLRCAIAALYAWRANNATDPLKKTRLLFEADFAYRQAYAFCPYAPEIIQRYVVNFLLPQFRFEEARQIVLTFRRLDPLNNYANTILSHILTVEGEMLLQRKDHEGLVRLANLAKDQLPDRKAYRLTHDRLLTMKVQSLIALDRNEDALRALGQLRQRQDRDKPQNKPALQNITRTRIQLLSRLRRYEAIGQELSTLANSAPNDTNTLKFIKTIQGLVQNIRFLDQQFTRNPTNYQAALILANAHRTLGDFSSAYAIAAKCASRPNDPFSLVTAAQIYNLLGDFTKKEPVSRRIAELNPSSPESWFDLSLVLAQVGKTNESLSTLRRALDFNLRRLTTNSQAFDIRTQLRSNRLYAPLEALPAFQEILRTNTP